VHRVDRDDRPGQVGERPQQVSHRGDLVRLRVHGDLAGDRADAVRQRRDQVRGLPGLVLRAADRLAVDRDHQRAAGLHGPDVQPGAENPVEHVRTDQGERPPERGLLRRAAIRAQPGQHRRAGIGGPLPDRGERPGSRDHRRDPDGEQPGQCMPTAAPLPGSGTWARRSSRYWLRATGIGKDVIGGRASLGAGDGERENFHRSARAPPATRRHAGHLIRRYDTAGHSLHSGLCRIPARWPRPSKRARCRHMKFCRSYYEGCILIWLTPSDDYENLGVVTNFSRIRASSSFSASPPDLAPPGRKPRSWKRNMQRFLIAVIVLLAIFSAVTARLFIWPTTGMPIRVDAIVVPGGPGHRVDAAVRLAEQNRARYLVISETQYVPPNLCGAHVGTVLVLCFLPAPATTQGEAEVTSRLARQYGWRSIVLLTTPDQTWRAVLRFRRCYAGSIYRVTTPLPLHLWPFHIAYQWAATVKAELVNRGC